MYRYRSLGCYFKDNKGSEYVIDMTTPFLHETERDASKDLTIYRFRREDKKVKLIAYQSEWFKTEKDEQGRSVARSVAVGDPISKYTYKQFKDLGGSLKKRAGDEEKAEGVLLSDEFSESALSFDEIFPDLPPGREIYIRRGIDGEIYREK